MKFEERYKLQVPIEQTERGTLWSGQDTKLSRKVVVAVVEADAPEALRERFAEQMGKLAALRHANLVRVLEVGKTEEDAPFASMELAEGDTLAKRMAEGPPMRADQAIRMIADLCGALSALHAAGVTHGDVHPGNVLVKELGGRVTPKLAGVGLNGAAQRKGDDEAEELLALAYMAPAQARGEVLADEASDVYSTAAMVFSLLTGRLPHRGGTAEALRAAVRDRPAPSASDVRAELAGPIGEVLDAALSPDPTKRFGTADALAKGLRAALIRTRTPGALETMVGARALEADESDVELAEKRSAPKAAAAPARPGKPAASKGIPPAKPLPKLSKPVKPAAPAEPKAKVVEPPSAAEPAADKASEEALEFERLSGLLEVSEVFAAAAKPPPPPPPDAHKDDAPSAKGKDDSLEFERLSGLLEIGKLEPEKAAAPPPPPPTPASERDEAAEAAPVAESAAADEDAGGASEAGAAAEGATADVETGAATAPEEAPSPATVAAVAAATSPAPMKEAVSKAAPVSAAKDASPKDVAAAKKDEPAKKDAATEAPAKAAPAKDPDVFEAEEIAGMASGPPPWVWAAVGVGLAAAIVVGVVVFSSGDDPGEETALAEPPTDDAVGDPVEAAPDETVEDVTAAAALPSPAEASDPEPSPPDEAPAPPEEPVAEQVTLTLTGVPEGATVTVDGEAVEGTEIALAPSEAARTVAVRLEGHEDWSRSVPGDSSADVRVDLVEIAEAEEPRSEPRASRRRPSRTERARAQRSRTERSRAARSRTERARPERARAQPARRSSRRPGSRPTAVSDPGF